MTGLDFIKYRMDLRLRGTVNQTPADDVWVRWVEIEGGTLDPVTGALLSGVQTPASGVLRALGIEEPGRSVVRNFAEIKAGDLILETDAAGTVTLPDGTEPVGRTTVCLDDIDTPRFLWAGHWYVQKEVGEGLAAAWNEVIGNQRLMRTMLLRKAT